MSRHGLHNHPFDEFKEGHRRFSKLSPSHKRFLNQQRASHISPGKARDGLIKQFPDIVPPKIRQLYNHNVLYGQELNGDRSRAQQMIHEAVKHNYVFRFTTNPDTQELKFVFMAHPESVKMFRSWPLVLVIDSTYKTNRFKLTLVEVVGVSPVGKSFLVAYCFIDNEETCSYVWVLENVKALLVDGSSPGVIVTDRELGLMKAIETVFPRAKHMLCLWHVYSAVEAKALPYFRENPLLAQGFAWGAFKKLVHATTEDEFKRNWAEMCQNYWHKGGLLKYIHDFWFEYVELWCKKDTNKVLHLGNTASSRVESAHAVLKKWLESSRLALDGFWARAHSMLEGQHTDIRAALADSTGRAVSARSEEGNIFGPLSFKVSTKAVVLMRDEFKRGSKLLGDMQARCGHVLVRTHGLVCACRLHEIFLSGERVHLDMVHDFWKTLSYGPPDLNQPVATDELESVFDEIRELDPARRMEFLDGIRSHLHPDEDDIQEPAVVENVRGRPKKSTTRNKSLIEHLRRKYKASTSKSKTSNTSTVSSSTASSYPTGNLIVFFCTVTLCSICYYV